MKKNKTKTKKEKKPFEGCKIVPMHDDDDFFLTFQSFIEPSLEAEHKREWFASLVQTSQTASVCPVIVRTRRLIAFPILSKKH